MLLSPLACKRIHRIIFKNEIKLVVDKMPLIYHVYAPCSAGAKIIYLQNIFLLNFQITPAVTAFTDKMNKTKHLKLQ